MKCSDEDSYQVLNCFPLMPKIHPEKATKLLVHGGGPVLVCADDYRPVLQMAARLSPGVSRSRGRAELLTVEELIQLIFNLWAGGEILVSKHREVGCRYSVPVGRPSRSPARTCVST
jgi:hypothetical protein